MTAIDDGAQFTLFGLEMAEPDAPRPGIAGSTPAGQEEVVAQPPVGNLTAAACAACHVLSEDGASAPAPEPAVKADVAAGAPSADARPAVSSVMGPASSAKPRPQTLEDALQQIATMGLLEPEVLRHVRSDIVVAAKMIDLPDVPVPPEGGHAPAAIPCDPEKLRPLLDSVRPARFGRNPDRWSSIRSSTARVLRLTGWLDDRKRDRTPLPEPWKVAAAQISHVARHAVFARFGRFCLARGIAPGEVGAGTLAEFRTHRLCSSLDPHVSSTIYALRRAWNDLAATLPAWGGRPLGPAPRRGATTQPLPELNPAFAADVDAYLERLANPDPFDHIIRKARSPATIKGLRSIMRRAASTLASAGWRVGDVSSVRDLVRPNAVKAILRDQWDRVGQGKAWPPGAVTIASDLKMIAGHCPELSEEDRAAVASLCGLVKNHTKGVTAKNRRRLAEFDDPKVLARFLCLPDECFAEADRLYATGREVRAAQIHQRAIALSLLICKPLRKLQLARLDIRHFKRDRKQRLSYFCIPGEETKNGQDNEAVLPEALVRRLDIHMKKYRPLLKPGNLTSIFVGRPGKQISAEYLAHRITWLVEDRVGSDFSVHFARHLAATLLLDEDPNNGPVAQRLLDHTTIKTTLRYYGAQRTRGAQQEYIRVIAKKTMLIRKGKK